MANLSRSAGLTGYADLARALGLDPLRLAADARLPVAALSDPDLKIASSSVSRMLEAAARISGAEDFGLRLAEKRQLSNMGAVGLIAREQPTLRKALDVMAQYQWMQNDAVSVRIEEAGDIGVVRLDFDTQGKLASRQAIELSIGVLCRNIRTLLGERWRPEAVCFRHAPPKKLDTYRRVFGVVPRFGQDFNGIVLPRKELIAPLAASDPVMARHIERYVQQLAVNRDRSTQDEAAELVLLLLPTGRCTAAQVAKHMGIDRRTLHRRLGADATTFSVLLDKKRAELSLALMSQGDRSLGAIAEQLGFSGASAFTHWFRRRFKTAPRLYRQNLLAGRRAKGVVSGVAD